MTLFWTSNPGLLISDPRLSKLWPNRTMSYADKLNAITRLCLVLGVLSYKLTGSVRALAVSIATIIGIVGIHMYYEKTGRKLFEPFTATPTKKPPAPVEEGFRGAPFAKAGVRLPKTRTDITNVAELDAVLDTNFDKPTPTNPFSNVLLTDIVDNPEKKSAPPAFQDHVYKSIKENAKKTIQMLNPSFPGINDELFGSLGDNFEFENSMRPFYSTPNTRVANDQGSFAQYCYGNMQSCKDGDTLMCSSSDALRYFR